MKADNITLQGILNSPNRYIIPVFQRYYSWGKKEWAQLWENILELRENPDVNTHFLGALVFVPDSYTQHTMPTYLIIDGQQRLITLSLMLCALRNLARTAEYEQLAAEITDTVLLHPYKRGQEHYRLYPRQRDRAEYLAILKHQPYKGERGRITDTLIFFVNALQELPEEENFTEEELRGLFEMLKEKLQFVYITLDEENPYRIFKSLNSTGMNLSESDLIRNFMLMSVSTDTSEQDAFDDEYWRPLEKMFTDDSNILNNRDFSIFFRDFLMTDGRYIPLSSTFYYFERRYHTADFDPTALTVRLQEVAALYNTIRGLNAHPHKEINRALHRLRLLSSTRTYPLVLHLLLRLDDGDLTVDEFVTAVDMVRDFLYQHYESEQSNRSLSRWFVSACRYLEDDPIPNLRDYLIDKGFDPHQTDHLP